MRIKTPMSNYEEETKKTSIDEDMLTQILDQSKEQLMADLKK